MSNRREQGDVWAETHVLDVQPVLQVVSRDSDNLALYDEYVRELADSASHESVNLKRAAGRRKR